MTALAVSLALAASLLTGLVTAPDAHASAAGDFISKINSARRSAGLASLASNSSLSSVARSWAGKMAKGGLAHNPNLGSQVSGWRYLGENVGVGGSVSSLHSAFMGSSGHRANILSSRYTQVGVGVVSSGGQLWVVEVFRTPTGATAPRQVTKKPAAKKVVKKVATKPAVKKTVKKVVKKVAAKPAAKKVVQKKAPARTVKAVPISAAPHGFGAIFAQLRGLAFTNALGDAWSWFVHRVLGVGSTYGV